MWFSSFFVDLEQSMKNKGQWLFYFYSEVNNFLILNFYSQVFLQAVGI